MKQEVWTRTNELVVEVSNLTNIEDIEKIVKATNIARDKVNSLSKLSFRLGDKVSFKHKNNVIPGKIKKINPKNIIVEVESGPAWTVWPSLLEKVSS